MNVYQIPPKLCPKCGELIDGCSAVGDEKPPSAGDLTICLKCAEVLRFVGDQLDLVFFDVSALPLRERIFVIEAQAIARHAISQRKAEVRNDS